MLWEVHGSAHLLERLEERRQRGVIIQRRLEAAQLAAVGPCVCAVLCLLIRIQQQVRDASAQDIVFPAFERPLQEQGSQRVLQLVRLKRLPDVAQDLRVDEKGWVLHGAGDGLVHARGFGRVRGATAREART